MAVTPTARLALNTWPLGTDPYRRQQRNADAARLDDLVAMDMQGTLADRPAPSAANRGLFYTVVGDATAANNGRVYRSDGTAWLEALTALTGLRKAGDTATGQQDQSRGRLADANGSAIVFGADIVESSAANTTFLRRVMRRVIEANGPNGVAALIERVTDVTIQSALSFYSDHIGVEAPLRVQNGPRIGGVRHTDRAGGVAVEDYRLTGGIYAVNNIVDVNVSPLDYPLGLSFSNIGGQTGWPEAYGTVVTFRGSNYVRQEFTPAASAAGGAFNRQGAGRRYIRLGIAENGGAGSDGWTSWQEAHAYSGTRHHYIGTGEGTTSTAWVNLATYGPYVDLVVPESGKIRSDIQYQGPGDNVGLMSTMVLRVSDGAVLQGANDDAAAVHGGGSDSRFTSAYNSRIHEGLDRGENVRILSQYRSINGATATFYRRQVLAYGLP